MTGHGVVFMGTPEFALPSLEALLSAGYAIVGVYAQPDKPVGRGLAVEVTPVKRYAQERGLPVFQPPTWKDAAAQEQLLALRPEVIVVAAYGRFLPSPVLRAAPRGCVNVHPSLLPKYRGPSPVASALLAGEEVTGVTLMLLDEGMDSGPILAQATLPIRPEDTTGTLTESLARAGAHLLVEALPRWLAGTLVPTPQDHARATVTRKVEKADGELQWELSAVELWRRVRAYTPWPGCSTRWKGKLLKVWEAAPLAESVGGAAPGTVVAVGQECGVMTGRGVLALKRVQLEGKRVLGCAEFLNGARDFVGSVLPS